MICSGMGCKNSEAGGNLWQSSTSLFTGELLGWIFTNLSSGLGSDRWWHVGECELGRGGACLCPTTPRKRRPPCVDLSTSSTLSRVSTSLSVSDQPSSSDQHNEIGFRGNSSMDLQCEVLTERNASHHQLLIVDSICILVGSLFAFTFLLCQQQRHPVPK